MFGTMPCNVPLIHHTFVESFDLWINIYTKVKVVFG